ncbi:hypothetical protein [Hydrocarboniphaga sp.]|uniref:hypothetical protein n=1 Tax=Hydrocarboniphaga sp. TaxID=2033016 RepID=UPI002ABB1F74|nr:hypothetical protein [Hydrocarboniphaga sp.]MDZ4078396.1 hypothetical protein [Hydrocarboniphaga sp.]
MAEHAARTSAAPEATAAFAAGGGEIIVAAEEAAATMAADELVDRMVMVRMVRVVMRVLMMRMRLVAAAEEGFERVLHVKLQRTIVRSDQKM